MEEYKKWQWTIWSFEHQAWWKPARRGYTTHMLQAGVYSFNEAIEICADANRFGVMEAMVPIPGSDMSSMEPNP